jgi:hypothetical protein
MREHKLVVQLGLKQALRLLEMWLVELRVGY